MIVIHPSDPTTDFLKSIYSGIPEVTLFTDWHDRNAILKAIEGAPSDELICLLGHGSPEGLFYRHPDGMSILFGEEDAHLLQNRPNVIGIWCHATDYALNNGLSGLYSGMFISEYIEAFMCGVEAEPEEIVQENFRFSKMLGNCLRNGFTLEQTAREIMDQENMYSDLTEFNYSLFRVFVHSPEVTPISDSEEFLRQNGAMPLSEFIKHVGKL